MILRKNGIVAFGVGFVAIPIEVAGDAKTPVRLVPVESATEVGAIAAGIAVEL
jgi:hypothetical protein